MNTKELISHLIHKGWSTNTVYDIGANKGNWTLEWSNTLPNAQFICFEANQNHKRPSRLNEKHRWYNAVLSDVSGKEVHFYDLKSTGDSYYQENTNHFHNCEPTLVTTSTLDEIVERDNLAYPEFIKIDTQGSEIDIFKGANNVMKNAQVIHVEMPVLEYNKGAPSFSDYIEYLSDYNFYPLALDEVHRSGTYIIQIDMCFVRNDVKLKYWPKRQGDIIL